MPCLLKKSAGKSMLAGGLMHRSKLGAYSITSSAKM
jgi:hypothetical protein